MKTYSPKQRDIERRWYVIDAQGAVLGRLASEVAKILRGKHKPIFAPHADTGDHVIVVNARGVRLTGSKEQDKVLYHHSGYPGGLRRVGYARLMSERPSLAVEKAIRGMLPKNRLGRQMIKKLAVYEGGGHPHEAQRPQALQLGQFPKWQGLPKRETSAAPAAKATRTRRRGRPGRAGAAPSATGRSRSAGATAATRPPAARAAPAKARASARRGKASAGAAATTPPKSRSAGSAAGTRKKSTRAASKSEKKPVRPRGHRPESTKES